MPETNNAGSVNGGAGSNAGNNTNPNEHSHESQVDGQGDVKKGSVSFDTFQKLLDQKKRQDKIIEDLKIKEQQDKEKDLQEKQQYKQLYEDTKKKAEELENRFGSLKKERIDDFKISAFVSKLPGQLLKDDYLAHAKISDIIFDEENGTVNDDSVKQVVDRFVKEHSHLIAPSKKIDLPNDAPGKAKGKLSYSDWLKLPKHEKERRLRDVE